jgi:predicted metalloendopeptidase
MECVLSVVKKKFLSGRQYDAIGQMKTWWSNETMVAFDERKQCFIDQFDNMTVYLLEENITIPVSWS